MKAGGPYLLDTNVLSETRKRQADPNVMSFIGTIAAHRLFISVLTLGEMRKGVERKRSSDPTMAASLADWVDTIELAFADRVLPIDAQVARRWGELSADRTRPVIDTLIAATALTHGLTLVTRNADDVRGIDLPMIDPWTPVSSPFDPPS